MPSSKPSAPNPQVLDLLGELPRELFPDSFTASALLVERYGAALRLALARRLGLPEALSGAKGAGAKGAGDRTAAEIAEARGFTASFRPALAGLLAELARDGVLMESGGGDAAAPRYRLARSNAKAGLPEPPLAEPPLAELRAALLELDPANAPTLELLDAAAGAYPEVARGETRGEDVLLGPAGAALWGRYFTNENPLYGINNRVCAVAAANRLPEEGPFRVLEVGAGGGSAGRAFLEELERRGSLERLDRYRVTEPSPFFRRRSQRALGADWPDVPFEFAALDIDLPWDEQGAEEEGFDLVFGVNVFHVARDLPSSLDRARRALVPGGWVVAGECLRPEPGQPLAAELVFRLLEGFTEVETDPELRPHPGFLTPERWEALLAAAGFAASEIVPNLTAIRELTSAFLTGAVCGRRQDPAYGGRPHGRGDPGKRDPRKKDPGKGGI